MGGPPGPMGVVRIVEAAPGDLDAVLQVERLAFAREDEARLVAALLQDPTAQPGLSLLAYVGEEPAGHALFTPVRIEDAGCEVPAQILAPLAVVPKFQRQGVGRALIEHGASLLGDRGVGLVFVLGDPDYYRRRGFMPTRPLGLLPPYPVEPDAAWRVRILRPMPAGSLAGTVQCARSLCKPEYWRE